MNITKTVKNEGHSSFELTMKAEECHECKGMFHPFDLIYYSDPDMQYSLCDECAEALGMPEGE